MHCCNSCNDFNLRPQVVFLSEHMSYTLEKRTQEMPGSDSDRERCKLSCRKWTTLIKGTRNIRRLIPGKRRRAGATEWKQKRSMENSLFESIVKRRCQWRCSSTSKNWRERCLVIAKRTEAIALQDKRERWQNCSWQCTAIRWLQEVVYLFVFSTSTSEKLMWTFFRYRGTDWNNIRRR